MRLRDFIDRLIDLEQLDPANENLQVFYRHGASGECGELSTPYITNEVSPESGPFDLEFGENYVSIYAGN